MSDDPARLTEPFVLEYTYKRSLGPVMSGFFEALRRGRLTGARAADGRVLVPPREYDPATGEPTEGLVELPPVGVVTRWSWVPQPAPHHPLDRPFAWALIRLEGADSELMHAVDAGDPARMRAGMAVRARWAAAPSGGILDLACFVPDDGASPSPPPEPEGPLKGLRAPTRLAYTVSADASRDRFLRGLAEGELRGQRCPGCERVYVPARPTCPVCAVGLGEEVVVADTGVVTTFCVVNIPFEGQLLTPPYGCAHVLLDGADVPIFAVIGGCPAAEMRMGMRVRAVWSAPGPDGTRPCSWASLAMFEPTGEPDADYESYKEHV